MLRELRAADPGEVLPANLVGGYPELDLGAGAGVAGRVDLAASGADPVQDRRTRHPGLHADQLGILHFSVQLDDFGVSEALTAPIQPV